MDPKQAFRALDSPEGLDTGSERLETGFEGPNTGSTGLGNAIT